jgi:hypothetical protein
MMRGVIALAVLGCAFTSTALGESLSVTGIDLGRINRSSLPQQVDLMASGDGSYTEQGFIVARFQNNQPLMKVADGTWQAWDGDASTLAFINIYAPDGVLRFPVGAWPTQDVLGPSTFTIGYKSPEGLKFGYFTVDGQ